MGTVNLKTASGGSVILSPTNTAVDTTITVPAISAPMAINGPAFGAYKSTNQTITSGTATKVTFSSTSFDTNSNFSTANSRFTPTVAGYYQVNIGMDSGANTTATYTRAIIIVYKNGTQLSVLQDVTFASPTAINKMSGSLLVQMNGSTDYLEFFCFIFTTGTAVVTGSNDTFFQAAMVRSA